MAREEPSKLPMIIAGGIICAALVAIAWQEMRYLGATGDIKRLNAEVSQQSVECRQNQAALEVSAQTYRVEAEQLRNQLAQATADRPLDHLKPLGGEDLDQCRQSTRDIFETRVMPLARRACSGGGRIDPALAAAWKAIAKDAADWVDFLKARLPGISPSCFEKLAVDAPAAGRADNDLSTYPDLPTLISSYCVISPNRNLCLYLDYPTGEPDSSARLWDVNNNRELWKLDCGPSCHWDYAAWIDANTAAVIGLVEAPYNPLPIWTPEVRLVQFKDGKVTVTAAFRGPDLDVSATTGAPSYAEQHKKWFTRKGMSRAQ